MLEAPEIINCPERLTAVIRFTIPREQIQQVMGPGFGELMSTLAAQGIPPAGPLYSHHYRMDPKTFDFEIGAPVDSPVKSKGRVRAGRLPAGRVARAVYVGSYEGLSSAWGEFMEWLKANDYTTASNLWEFYTVGPESGLPPSQYRTELNRPLVG